MKPYDSYYEAFGSRPIRDFPPREFKWFAYKTGCVKEFTDQKSALKFSTLIERVQTNKEEIEAILRNNRNIEKRVYELWLADLRSEYSNFSDEQFNLAMSFVQNSMTDSYSDRYDYLAEKLSELFQFLEQYCRSWWKK